MFDYFYGAQAEQFAFYRVPKVLFTNERFKYLSAEAKTLYGILLDRVPLSAKNGWIDEQGRVYIICTIEEIMEDMNCGNKKAIQLLSDLEDKVGLIERKRQGLGKPNLIYVKNFISVDSPVERHFLKCQNDTSGSVEITSLEVSKGHGNKTDIINTEYSDTDSFYSDRNVGKGSEAMGIRAQYEDYFRESLELDYLSLDRTLDQDTIQAMVDLMVDVCCSTRKSIRINREDMPIEVVKSRFMKLDAEHIKYALMTLANNTTRVKDMKQYMLAVLYNAPTTISSYYQNWVQHDMAKDMDKELKELQKQFMPEDTKAGLIQSFLDNFKGTQVCSKLIYAEALNHPFDEPKQWEIREINEIMNNSIDGWAPFSNPRIFAKYGRQRGWERIPSGNELSATGSNLPDGFRELTEEEARQMELPF